MKKLILLVGPMGSGKSSFATQKLHAVSPHVKQGLVRISQDDLGKKRYLDEFNKVLSTGRDIVVDRINHTKEQREKFLKPAKDNGYKTSIYWINVPKAICLERIKNRKNHPTIDSESPHEAILGMYFRDFEEPKVEECDELVKVPMDQYANIVDLRKIVKGKQYMVIGDIHGCYGAFMRLLDKAAKEYKFDISNDIIISVGDMVDRGPSSALVLNWFYSNSNCYVLEGNHENKLKRWLMGRGVSLANGLLKTTQEIEAQGLDKEALLEWMSGLPHIFRLPDINDRPQYVVHAGFDPSESVEWQKKENCLYMRFIGGKDFRDESGKIWYSLLNGEYEVISGHIIHKDIVRPNPNIVCLDGGAYEGGELRGLLNGRELISVNGER